MHWDDASATLHLEPTRGTFPGAPCDRTFRLRLPDRAEAVTVAYTQPPSPSTSRYEPPQSHPRFPDKIPCARRPSQECPRAPGTVEVGEYGTVLAVMVPQPRRTS